MRTKCSPARALEAKTFSTGYWQWQHRFLLDALRQFGYPSVFLTISPYEWTFPFPEYLQKIRQATGNGPTNLASLETLHITHVLEQLVRGYTYADQIIRNGKLMFSTTAASRTSRTSIPIFTDLNSKKEEQLIYTF